MKQLPSLDELRDWLAQNPGSGVREIARAFGIKGPMRRELRPLTDALADEGLLPRRRANARDMGRLPPVAVLEITGPDDAGDLFATPVESRLEGMTPRILVVTGPRDGALGAGDRVLARLQEVRAPDHDYQARPIRKLGTNPARVLGIFRAGSQGGRITPIDKGADREWIVPAGETGGAQDGELVEAQALGRASMGLPRAKVTDRLGDPGAPKAVSLIAIHQHGIRDHFPDTVVAEADAMTPAGLEGREDLTGLPLMTIDPADARDHDDAIAVLPDDDPGNDGGFVIWVAIADVAHYVRPGSELDREARMRGNSTYFPDRVVPMLPDRLSGDLCSLHEGVDRACMAVRMVIDARGVKLAHRFVRGVMRSRASLTYGQAQAAEDGRHDAQTEPLAAEIGALFAAYRALRAARAQRQPLDLDLPERRIELSEDGRVASVAFRERLDAHRLVEEFMVLANVAAAEELVRRRSPFLFRVHEEPSPEKLDALREVAVASGFTLAKGQVLQTRHLNNLLAQAEGTEFDELINISTLRSMTQAYYAPQNFGHFGLALRAYAHFTSPIRRYADLIVHRALIAAHGWGDDGLARSDTERLEETATLISEAERRSMAAERDTNDRYLAAFLADRIGAELSGRVSGVTRYGLFIKLDETGADGLVPVRSLGDEYFRHDAETQQLVGERSGVVFGLGQRAVVKLAEAEPETGGLVLELLEIEGQAVARSRARPGRRGAVGRKAGKLRAGKAKAQRKAERKRRG